MINSDFIPALKILATSGLNVHVEGKYIVIESPDKGEFRRAQRILRAYNLNALITWRMT